MPAGCRRFGIADSWQKILKAFNRARIPVMALKGPILSFELYGDVGLRQSKDLDLVIVPGQCIVHKPVSRIWAGVWIQPSLHMTPRQWEEFWQMKDDLVFIHAEPGSRLEIHSRIHRGYPEQNCYRWARSIPQFGRVALTRP